MDAKHAAAAAKAIARKADRILERLDPAARGADEQRRHAAALLHLASSVAGDPAYSARAGGDARAITGQDNERAAELVEALATRAEGRGDLRAEIAFYEIALSLHPHDEWPFMLGTAQLQVQDVAGAKRSFERVKGYHAESSRRYAMNCGLVLSGVDLAKAPKPANPDEAHDRQMVLFYLDDGPAKRRAKADQEAAAFEERQRAEAAQPKPAPIPLAPGADPKLIAAAANAIAKKGERALGGIKTPDRNAAEKRRHASALVRIAGELSAECAAAARVADAGAEITAPDRERAGVEVYALASRAQSAGKFRDALTYFDIALSLHHEGYWLYLKAIQQQQLGEFAAAAGSFDAVQGQYAQYAKQQAAQCRAELDGTGGKMFMDNALAWLNQVSGGGAGAPGALQQLFSQMLSGVEVPQAVRTGAVDERAAPSAEAQAELDIASETAQVFAEHLARGNFDAADGMLVRSLQTAGGAEDLRAAWLAMIQHDDDDAAPDDAATEAMSADVVAEDARQPGDLGCVYVAVRGEEFSEAITVIVTRVDGEPRIRDIEWGAP